MRIFVNIISGIIGLFFIFSGVIKTIDPIGFSLKLEEYFSVFHLTELNSYALIIATTISIVEVLLGLFLFLGIKKKFTLWSMLIMIIFFAFLTFYSAYFEVVKDCGCFGDAIKLTPWESFAKDIILLVIILFLLKMIDKIELLFNKRITYYIIGISLLAIGYIAYMGIFQLPIVDFRPFAVGQNLKDGLKSAEDLGLDPPEYEIRYNLKNKVSNFDIQLSEEEYIGNKTYWQKGTPWELVGTEEELVSEGYEPPIHDFIIDCGDSGDMTFYYLNLPEVVLLITPVPSEASNRAMERVSKFSNNVKKAHIPVLSIASEKVVIGNLQTCLMDATTLKTMIRGNPGIMVLKNGTVVAKYHWRRTPSIEKLKNVLD